MRPGRSARRPYCSRRTMSAEPSRGSRRDVERDRDFALACRYTRAGEHSRHACSGDRATRAWCPVGAIDITLYRDDRTRIGYARWCASPRSLLRRRPRGDSSTMSLSRTIRALGRARRTRPDRARFACCSRDRGHRELPIRADFVGKNLPTATGDDVRVHLVEVDGRDEVEVVTRVPA